MVSTESCSLPNIFAPKRRKLARKDVDLEDKEIDTGEVEIIAADQLQEAEQQADQYLSKNPFEIVVADQGAEQQADQATENPFMSLLQDIFKGTLGPYKPNVTLTIVGVSPTKKYRVDGEDREMRSAVGTDGEHYARLNVYDKGKFTRLEVGNVLSLLNIITKKEDGRMVVVATKNSKVFIGQIAEVTDNQKAEASKILNPPPAATVPIAQAITSPVKTKISIEGKIVQEAQPQTVSVKGEDVQIKTIMVEDRSAKVKVTLWREAANAEVRPGDYISITDAVTNTWKNETSLSTTSVSTIQEIVGADQGAEQQADQATENPFEIVGADQGAEQQADQATENPFEIVGADQGAEQQADQATENPYTDTNREMAEFLQLQRRIERRKEAAGSRLTNVSKTGAVTLTIVYKEMGNSSVTIQASPEDLIGNIFDYLCVAVEQLAPKFYLKDRAGSTFRTDYRGTVGDLPDLLFIEEEDFNPNDTLTNYDEVIF